MNKIKATLISVNDGFKIIKEKVLDQADLPINCFSREKSVEGKKVCDHEYECSYNFNYYWITTKMFPDEIIADCQSRQGFEKGHPDFIIYNPNNPHRKKYIEFKSQSDALALCQIKWIIQNPKREKYILFIEDYFEGI